MLGDTVERLCREQGMSLAELERRAGVGQGQIKKWKALENAPRADKVLAVARVLGVTMEELMREEV